MKDEEDSSSDEDDQMLREALDPQMFSIVESAPKENVNHGRSNSYKDNILNVTPEFQEFVGKRLLSLLDNTIEEYQSKDRNYESDQSTGIRLFNDSKAVLEDVNVSVEPGIKSETLVKRRKNSSLKRASTCNSEKELSHLEKVQEAAVSPEWILSGESTREWSKPKGEMFAYVRNENGVLELKNNFS